MFDLKGAARDAEQRASRWSVLLSEHPDLILVYRMLVRHPWAAREAARAVNRIIAAKPEKVRSLKEPLFPEAS
jgi:hypothetical protein